jgi:hypothetical protein
MYEIFACAPPPPTLSPKTASGACRARVACLPPPAIYVTCEEFKTGMLTHSAMFSSPTFICGAVRVAATGSERA